MHDYLAYLSEEPGLSGTDKLGKLENFLDTMLLTAIDIEKSQDKSNKDKLINSQKSKAQTAITKFNPHLSNLLAQALEKDIPDASLKKKPCKIVTNAIRNAWVSALSNNDSHSHSGMLVRLRLTPDLSEVGRLPYLSFMLSFPFCLDKPYISKDDEHFHLLDNPVRKEKLFHNPMVPSTAWKGAMRHALWNLQYVQGAENIDDASIDRLFGKNDANEADEFISGRLHFFSTYFDRTAIEIINPHDRKSGTTAHGPILMEAVPAHKNAVFTLLYLFSPDQGESSRVEQQALVAHDLTIIARGISAMMTIYGFGAKTSSGFGVAKEELPAPHGKIAIRLPEQESIENSSHDVLWSFGSFTELRTVSEQLGQTLTDGVQHG